MAPFSAGYGPPTGYAHSKSNTWLLHGPHPLKIVYLDKQRPLDQACHRRQEDGNPHRSMTKRSSREWATSFSSIC
jgi:hypothetical protein